VRSYRLSHPQRGSQVDIDHELQRLGCRAERVSLPECPDGIHQDGRRPDLAGEPVHKRRRRRGIGGVGYLAPDAAGQFPQRVLSPVDSHHCEATVGEDRCCGAPELARSDHDRYLGAHDAYLLTAVGVEPNDYERTCPTVGPDTVS
jgi:hypothetical protein